MDENKTRFYSKPPYQLPKVRIVMCARGSGKQFFIEKILKEAKANNEKIIITRKKR